MSNKSEPRPKIWAVRVPTLPPCQPQRLSDRRRTDIWDTWCSQHQTIFDAAVALFRVDVWFLPSLNALLIGKGLLVVTSALRTEMWAAYTWAGPEVRAKKLSPFWS